MTAVDLTLPRRRSFLSKYLPRAKGLGIGLLVPITLLILWQIASIAGWISLQILPAPLDVFRTGLDLWHSGDLALHGAISLQRIFYGFAIGAALGLILGLGMGLSSVLEAIFMPAIRMISQVPLIGWLPFLIIIAGLGEAPKLIIIAKAAFLPIALKSFEGVRSIPRHYFEVADSFQFSQFQSFRRIVFPGALGQVFTGLRYGLTKSWTALVAVELLASTEGLGYLLVWGRQMFWMDLVIATMVIIGLAGFAIDYLFERLEQLMQRWRPDVLDV